MRIRIAALLVPVLALGCLPCSVGQAKAPKVTIDWDAPSRDPPRPPRPAGATLGRQIDRRIPVPTSDAKGLFYRAGRSAYVTFVFDRETMSPWRLRTPRGHVRAEYDFWQYGHRDKHGELDIPAMGGFNTLTISAPRNLPILLRFGLGRNDPHYDLDRVSPEDNGKPLVLKVQRTRRAVYGSTWLTGGFHVITWDTRV
jgi:hypothetical protein